MGPFLRCSIFKLKRINSDGLFYVIDPKDISKVIFVGKTQKTVYNFCKYIYYSKLSKNISVDPNIPKDKDLDIKDKK